MHDSGFGLTDHAKSHQLRDRSHTVRFGGGGGGGLISDSILGGLTTDTFFLLALYQFENM